MTDGELLLKGILANPADDTARLVYADWLQEQGQDERADFIRVQIELAPLEGLLSAETWLDKHLRMDWLRGRERRLLDAYHPDYPPGANWLRWAEPIRETGILLGRPWHERMGYRRGFVESITCSAADWISHGDAIRAAQPVTKVMLTTWPDNDATELVQRREPPYILYGFRGRAVRIAASGPAPLDRTLLPALLAAEWPGVTFELPAAYPPYGVATGLYDGLVAVRR